MTRLDPAGDPSMEDILASIRRIIAEDPPGSRPEPAGKASVGAAETVATPADTRQPVQGAQMGQPIKADPGIDAQSGQRAGQQTIQQAGQQAVQKNSEEKSSFSSFFSHRPANTARADDTAAPSTAPTPAAKPPSAGQPAPATGAPIFNIDAQLADVLGTPTSAAKSAPPAPELSPGTAPSGFHAATQDSVQAALDSLSKPTREDAPGDKGTSRGGLSAAPPAWDVPDAPASSSFNPVLESRPSGTDPFEFSLGPSPFARKPPTPTLTAANAPSAQENAASDPFGAFVPRREAEEPFKPELKDNTHKTAPVQAAVPFAESQTNFAARQPKGEPESDLGAIFKPQGPASFGPPPAQSASSQDVSAAPMTRPDTIPTGGATPAASGPFGDRKAEAAFTAFTPFAPTEAKAPQQTSESLKAFEAFRSTDPFKSPETKASESFKPTGPSKPTEASKFEDPIKSEEPIKAEPRVAQPVDAKAPASKVEPTASVVKDDSVKPTPQVMASMEPSIKAPDVTPALTPQSASKFDLGGGKPSLSDLAPRNDETAPGRTTGPARTAAPAANTTSSGAQASPVANVFDEETVEEAEVEIVVPDPEHTVTSETGDKRSTEPVFQSRYSKPEGLAKPFTPSSESRSLVPRDHVSQQTGQHSAVPRTMEETVAELLRPMLRTWLAENMPKIVERALRKELDDTARSLRKPAAE